MTKRPLRYIPKPKPQKRGSPWIGKSREELKAWSERKRIEPVYANLGDCTIAAMRRKA